MFFNGMGKITSFYNDTLFRVTKLKDLTEVIIPHFDKYPLLTKKRADFLLFKLVIELMNKGEHLTNEGGFALHKIVSIRASINTGLSPKLRRSRHFPNLKLVQRPLVEFTGIPDPHWLVGFVEGEGCFMIDKLKSSAYKFGFQTRGNFTLAQHSRDTELFKGLREYLDCGGLKK